MVVYTWNLPFQKTVLISSPWIIMTSLTFYMFIQLHSNCLHMWSFLRFQMNLTTASRWIALCWIPRKLQRSMNQSPWPLDSHSLLWVNFQKTAPQDELSQGVSFFWPGRPTKSDLIDLAFAEADWGFLLEWVTRWMRKGLTSLDVFIGQMSPVNPSMLNFIIKKKAWGRGKWKHHLWETCLGI